jgi:hypothetical protein
MAHSPAQPVSALPAPYRCGVCQKIYIHLFDHHCVVADACCHFGEMLVSDETGTPAPPQTHAPAPPIALPSS